MKEKKIEVNNNINIIGVKKGRYKKETMQNFANGIIVFVINDIQYVGQLVEEFNGIEDKEYIQYYRKNKKARGLTIEYCNKKLKQLDPTNLENRSKKDLKEIEILLLIKLTLNCFKNI